MLHIFFEFCIVFSDKTSGNVLNKLNEYLKTNIKAFISELLSRPMNYIVSWKIIQEKKLKLIAKHMPSLDQIFQQAHLYCKNLKLYLQSL